MFGIAWLSSKLSGLIALLILIGVFILIVRDDIHVRSNYAQSTASLLAIAKQQALEEKLAVEIKEKQDENFKTQDKALLEMHEKGYLGNSSSDNPDWMCASASGCH